LKALNAEEVSMQHLTVRNIPSDLASALKAEKARRRSSLNQTIIDLLRDSLGVGTGQPRSNGLEKLAGGWTQEEFEQFEKAVAVTEQIDEELWR
jgi:plasmid stability protein